MRGRDALVHHALGRKQRGTDRDGGSERRAERGAERQRGTDRRGAHVRAGRRGGDDGACADDSDRDHRRRGSEAQGEEAGGASPRDGAGELRRRHVLGGREEEVA
jgi:hypothetical protein